MHSAGFNSQKQSMRCRAMLVLTVIFLAGVCGSIAAPEDSNGVLRSRAYKFRHITSSQAQEMLSQLQIGQSFDALTDDVLIITSNSSVDLLRATEVITVLDQAEPVEMRVLGVAGPSALLPSPNELIDRLQTVIAGTMSDAPPKGSTNPGIIDRLGDKLIAIGTKPVVTEIDQAFQAWKEENPAPAEPEKVVKPETAVAPVKAAEPTVGKEVTPVPVTQEPPVQPEMTTVEEPEAAAIETKKPAAETDVAAEASEMTRAEKSLEEIAAELFAQPEQAASIEKPVTEDAVVEPEPEVPAAATVKSQMTITEDILIEERSADSDKSEEDDFMGDELLRTLEAEAAAKNEQLAAEEAAKQKAIEEAAKIAAAKAAKEQTAQPVVATQPETMSPAAKQRAEAIAAMRKQAEEEAKAAEAAKSQDNDELRKAIEALLKPEEPQAAEPEAAESTAIPAEQTQLQQELTMLRQQIAELKAAKQAPAEEEQSEAPTTLSKIAAKETQTAQTEFEEAIGDEMLDTVIDLPQEVELESLVDLVGKQLGLNYMYDGTILKNQKVLLKINKGKIKVRDLYALLESVLRFKGFIMTRRDNLVTIMRTGDMAKTNPDPVFRGPDDPIQPGDIIVSSVFQLNNIDANTAKKTLEAMKLSDLANGLQVVDETNTLIVTDYAYRMERIGEALDMIDVAGDPKEFEYRQLEYMQATELVEKLKKLIAEMEGVSLEVSSSTPAAPVKTRSVRTRDPQTGRTITKQVPINTAPPAGGSAQAQKGGVFIDVDERTNRVLMIGKRGDLDTLNQLIDTLDVPQQDLKYVREYVIQHVEAVEVVNVMNELGLASVKVAATTQTATQETARTARGQQPTPTRSTATTSAAGDDQPNIAIRPATNSLLVNATAEQHTAIELVIAHVDVVQKDQRTIREYEIQFVDTQEIIDTMTDLGMISSQSVSGSSASSRTGSSRSSSSRSSSNRNTQQPAAVQQEMAAPVALAGIGDEGGEPGSVTEMEPQISILEATNSLLVYATPRQHKAISLLIAHADRVPATTTTPYVVYALENQEPGKLAETLDQIVSARQADTTQKTSSAESKVQTKTPAATSSGSNIPNLEEENIRIIPDEDSYSLIVYANKRNQQWISELIKELDEYRPQVLLDCTLVEITKTDAFEYSIDLIAKTYGGSSIQAGSPVSGTAGSGDFSSRVLSDISSTGGTVKGFLNSEMVQGVLTALQKNGYGRIMAQPKILVNDNQPGVITTKTTTSVPQVTSQTTTTDGVTNTSENVTFDSYDKGVTLDILPHISKGDMLRLVINLNRTDFADKGSFTLDGEEYPIPPDLLSTDVTTTATVPDGTTIILGGLESVNQSKNQNKIPLLGDLPIVGGLFRDVTDSDAQSRLYVFVKANIIRPGDQIEGLEDIKRVSGKYRKDFEEMENKFQTMQDWPGIDSKPLEPVKVLEDDFEAESL